MLQIDNFIVCFLGCLTYIIFMFNSTKNKIDATEEKFDYKKYLEDTWDDWLKILFSSFGLLLISPDIYIYMHENYEFMEGITWSRKISYGIGLLGSIITQGIINIVEIKFKVKKNE